MDMEACYTSIIKESSQKETNVEDMKSGPPHESLFLVLPYLPLLELLAMSEVCRSLRDAVNKDVLVWLDIIVDRPLNLRLSDGILAEISSKANGRLQSLALLNCKKITNDGLSWVIQRNPLINKLYIPGCTGLTPEGVISIVKTLTEHHQKLKSLKINGIYNIQREHLEILRSCLEMNWARQEQEQQQQQRQRQPTFYHHRNFSALIDTGCSIDVDLCPKCCEVRMVFDCPKCCEVRMVFDCPKETCETKRERPLTGCRACSFCIPRCEECSGCVEFEEFEELGEAVCADTLCLNCWLQLPKCNFCNKPYCNRHAYQQCSSPNSTGFICGVCQVKFIETSYE